MYVQNWTRVKRLFIDQIDVFITDVISTEPHFRSHMRNSKLISESAIWKYLHHYSPPPPKYLFRLHLRAASDGLKGTNQQETRVSDVSFMMVFL